MVFLELGKAEDVPKGPRKSSIARTEISGLPQGSALGPILFKKEKTAIDCVQSVKRTPSSGTSLSYRRKSDV